MPGRPDDTSLPRRERLQLAAATVLVPLGLVAAAVAVVIWFAGPIDLDIERETELPRAPYAAPWAALAAGCLLVAACWFHPRRRAHRAPFVVAAAVVGVWLWLVIAMVSAR